LKATIYKSTGSFYLAQDIGGRLWKCRIRGKLKIDKEISSTNPVAVGDRVTFMIEDEADATAVIIGIDKRDNYIVRTSPHNKHQKHIVAANLDQALITITIHSPRTSIGFIDRFLVTAEAYHIPAILVFNKADLLYGDFRNEWQYRKSLYEKIGYQTFTCTATDGSGLTELKNQLHNKTTLFSGHSGVGKSTLINNLIPDKNLKVKEISDWSGKGQHTTTFAEMFDLPGGGRIIDTPGVKEFGIVGFDRYDLAHYFPEMRDRMSECRFNNCVHANEPGCAIKDAVMAGDISSERYESYLVMLADL
jgi:ribosome biogenesis GTPase